MKAWILSVGDEVLSGKIVNTNFSDISSYFNQIGIDVIKGITIGDDRNDIIASTIEFMENKNVDTYYPNAKRVPQDFEYNSGNNDRWLTIEDMRKLISEI